MGWGCGVGCDCGLAVGTVAVVLAILVAALVAVACGGCGMVGLWLVVAAAVAAAAALPASLAALRCVQNSSTGLLPVKRQVRGAAARCGYMWWVWWMCVGGLCECSHDFATARGRADPAACLPRALPHHPPADELPGTQPHGCALRAFVTVPLSGGKPAGFVKILKKHDKLTATLCECGANARDHVGAPGRRGAQ